MNLLFLNRIMIDWDQIHPDSYLHQIEALHVFHVLKDNSRTHNNLPIQPAYL